MGKSVNFYLRWERRRKLIFIGVLLALVLIFGSFTLWSLWQYHRSNVALEKLQRQSVAEENRAELLEKVGRHIILPASAPSIATVTNVAEMRRTAPMYQNAQNGDKILIYPKERKIIIYSPARDIIVNVGFLFDK